MANGNQFTSTVEALFKGMNQFIASKTVVGDPVQVGDTTIIPLIDVTFGMGAGAGAEDKRHKGNGGIGGKIVPSSVLVLRRGTVKLVNVKNQDAITKILDLVPDVVDRFTNKGKEEPEAPKASKFSPEVEDVIKKTVDDNTETI